MSNSHDRKVRREEGKLKLWKGTCQALEHLSIDRLPPPRAVAITTYGIADSIRTNEQADKPTSRLARHLADLRIEVARNELVDQILA